MTVFEIGRKITHYDGPVYIEAETEAEALRLAAEGDKDGSIVFEDNNWETEYIALSEEDLIDPPEVAVFDGRLAPHRNRPYSGEVPE